MCIRDRSEERQSVPGYACKIEACVVLVRCRAQMVGKLKACAVLVGHLLWIFTGGTRRSRSGTQVRVVLRCWEEWISYQPSNYHAKEHIGSSCSVEP
eukprot:2369685-Rhodomonas_salina.3